MVIPSDLKGRNPRQPAGPEPGDAAKSVSQHKAIRCRTNPADISPLRHVDECAIQVKNRRHTALGRGDRDTAPRRFEGDAASLIPHPRRFDIR